MKGKGWRVWGGHSEATVALGEEGKRERALQALEIICAKAQWHSWRVGVHGTGV